MHIDNMAVSYFCFLNSNLCPGLLTPVQMRKTQSGVVLRSLLKSCFSVVLFVLYSSKLAAVLRKLHNANDMLHLSAYETGKPNSPNTEETSVPQSSPTDNFDSNDDSQRDSVGQLSDVHKECNMADVGRETTSQECLVAKVMSVLCCCCV